MENNYTTIVSYDISRAGNQDTVNVYVKNRMIEKGYADRFINSSSGKTIYLPNTTLVKEKTTVEIARQDVQDCVDEFNKKNLTAHEAERMLATKFTGIWAAYIGTAYKSKSLAPKL